MAVSRLRRISTVEALVQAIRERILDGEWAPGAALREPELCEHYGVSRHSVRSALISLGHAGLVRHEPNRGVHVPELTIEDIEDLFRLRTILEVEAVGTLAESRSVPAAARAAVADLAGLDAPWQAILDADLRVHAALVAGLGSPRVDRAYDTMRGELQLSLRAIRAEFESHAHLGPQHAVILDAIEGGDREAAMGAMRAHLEEGLELVRP